MTKEEQKRLVEEQFALDYNCTVEDFQNTDTLVTLRKDNKGARKFEEESPLSILSYNGKLVINAIEELLPWCEEVLKNRISPEWCMEAGTLISIDKKLSEFDFQIDQAHVFFLPKETEQEDNKNAIVINQEQIKELEDDERIDEAFLFDDEIEDMIGVKIVDEQGTMVAVAGASNNSSRMWEMGVNSFVEGKGYGQAAVKQVKHEVQKLGVVPFYGTAMSHLASQRIALGASMVPAFTELRSVRK